MQINETNICICYDGENTFKVQMQLIVKLGLSKNHANEKK